MGLVKAAFGAIGGTFADQWKDFLTVPANVAPTAALFPAVHVGSNVGRGSNTQTSEEVVTNGSKIVVPEGYGLLLFEDGELTAFASEPGPYTWDSNEIYSQSIFAGDEVATSLVTQSWERFKFGGRPGTQQSALFVSLKQLPNNKFGTQAPVYWDDAYFNAQVGAITHGTYSMLIVDPIKFVKEVVPASYLQGREAFDFTDPSNPVSSQFFAEVVGSLASAFSRYANDSTQGNRISRIQGDSAGFARSMSDAVEDLYDWTGTRGVTLGKVTIMGIEYDEGTRDLLRTIQRADALDGKRGNANLQASVAAGMESAGEQGADGIIGMGIAGGSVGLPELMQEPTKSPPTAQADAAPTDLVTQLQNLQRALDAGLISQAEFDAARSKALGL